MLQVPAHPLGYLPDHLAADRADPKEISTKVLRRIGGDLGAEIDADAGRHDEACDDRKSHKPISRFGARFGSSAMGPVVPAGTVVTAGIVSGEAASEPDAMTSLASCRCGAARPSGWKAPVDISSPGRKWFCSGIGYQYDGVILIGSSFSRTQPPASGAQRAISNFPLASSSRIKNLSRPSERSQSVGVRFLRYSVRSSASWPR